MNPSEISLFTAKERTLLVETEPARLRTLGEDELFELVARVRRLRNKYSDLHRRQAADAGARAGARAGGSDAAGRTARKAEILEDALARVSHHASRSARAAANELKAERLANAAGSSGSARRGARSDATATPGSSRQSERSEPIVRGARVGATSAAGKRQQASKDRRRS